MAGRRCYVICRPRYGRAEAPVYFSSVTAAKAYAKKKMMTYRIFDESGCQITRGY